ncbi:major royal jelly protein 1 [Contarinia nasturtii]|uniref:major royal jelly protein 1 n=1 Tax=Contarinia nasturtii TaxID=265458 RepID=UPI0012D3AEF8|nr:major royal jelly protein 1 [Contarinia nasturtii]
MMRLAFVVTILIVRCSCIVPTQYGAVPIKYPEERSTEPCVEWTGGTFEWPCSQTKSLYKSSGKYISKNIIATRAQIIGDNVYVALPRYKSGVPATLARTGFKKGSCAATLSPFPCWSMQEEGNCQSLQSVVDIVADRNNILWALDVGVVNTLETPVRRCPPKVLAISTKTGKVLKTISLEKLVAPTSRLQYLAIDYKSENRCFIYISDAAQRSILVYDVQASRGFRIVLPKAVTNGCPKRDVLYLALINRLNGTSSLYFTYLSSKQLFVINTEYLRSGNIQGRITDVGNKPNKQVIIGTDNGAAMFFRYEGQSEVYRWDTNQQFNESNFKVVYRCQTCQLATHALADYNYSRMRVLESNFPDFLQNTVGCGAIQQLSVMQGCW